MTKKILVTGGSGFLGNVLVDRLIGSGDSSIRILARDEGKLSEVQRRHPRVEIFSGDISDPVTVLRACQGVDGIYHLAAAKFLDIAEKQPYECIQSNVIGTLNILEATRQLPIQWVTGISTDKAAQVNGVYGATKFLMEKLFGDYEKFNGASCRYRTVRYGNVLYSTGSVLVKWRKIITDIAAGKYDTLSKPIIITDPSATRFFWTVDQAVDLIFECEQYASSSVPYIPKMRAMRISDLLDAMIIKYYYNLVNAADFNDFYNNYVNMIGLQPGENMHEKLDDSGNTSENAPRYTISEILDLI